MKCLFPFLLFYISFVNGHSQNILIDFAATGAASTVDSVKIENLTQCTVIYIGGSDTLDLGTGAGMYQTDAGTEKKIRVYPNPVAGVCNIEFETNTAGDASISVFDITGKRMIQSSEFLMNGHHLYQLSGLSAGIYTLNVESETYCYNSKIVSINDYRGNTEIIHKETRPENIFTEIKNIRTQNYMQYNTGDLLKITGKSGIYRTVVMLTPSVSQTVTFTFIPCTDASGNNYSVVKIGNQWWMAENLNVGTFATITTPQVSGTKFCMDINGQEDPNCPMGGLYEWANLMQGASPCNGTGAPPNDLCNNPVKGLCPDGWHIPSHYEWTTLTNSAGGNFQYNSALGISPLGGGDLKLNCTNYWWSPNAGATNASGFSAVPGGDTWHGVFEDYGQSAYFWTSSAIFTYTYNPWVYALNYSVPTVGRSQYFNEQGFSCRCVRD